MWDLWLCCVVFELSGWLVGLVGVVGVVGLVGVGFVGYVEVRK